MQPVTFFIISGVAYRLTWNEQQTQAVDQYGLIWVRPYFPRTLYGNLEAPADVRQPAPVSVPWGIRSMAANFATISDRYTDRPRSSGKFRACLLGLDASISSICNS